MASKYPWDEGFPLQNFPAYSNAQSQLSSASDISSSWQGSVLPLAPPLVSYGISAQSLNANDFQYSEQVGVLPLQSPINTFGEPSQPVGFNRPGDNTFVHQNAPVMQSGMQSGPFLVRPEHYYL